MNSQPRAAKTSRARTYLRRGGITLAVVLVLGYILVPVIATRVAPGKISALAGEKIAGSVRVDGLSLGWSGPTTIDSLKLLDDRGGVVGTFSVRSSLGLWSAIFGGGDLGELVLRGRVDLVRTLDARGHASTNLQRALAPRASTSTGPGGVGVPSAGAPSGMHAAAQIEKLDVTYRELDAGGSTIAEAGMIGASGRVSLDTRGPGAVRAELTAPLADGPGAASLTARPTGEASLRASVDGFVDSAGRTDPARAKFTINASARRSPVALIDALGNARGLLLAALGASADLSAQATGTGGSGGVVLDLSADNADAALELTLANNRLTLTKPGRVVLKSAAGLLASPEIARALAGGGVSIAEPPRVEIELASLNLPASGGDLRAGALDVGITTTRTTGRVTLPGAEPRELLVSPFTLRLASGDLAQGLSVQGGVSTRIGGAPAGELSVDVQGSDLLDEHGALRPIARAGITGRVVAQGISASLLQPIVTAMGLPILVREDAGERLDVQAVLAHAPTPGERDLTLEVRGDNLTLSSPVHITSTRIEAPAFKLQVRSGAALVRRLVNRTDTSTMNVGGESQITASGSLTIPRGPRGEPLTNQGALHAAATLTDLTLTPAGAEAVVVKSLTLTGSAEPGQPLGVTLVGDVGQGGQPAKITGDLRVEGLLGGASARALPVIGPARVRGTIELARTPGALFETIGRALGLANTPGAGTLVREALGPGADAKMTLTPVGESQRLEANLAGACINATLGAQLTPASLEVSALDARVRATPALARAWRANAAGATLAHDAQLRVVLTESLSIPLRKNPDGSYALQPDFALAGDRVAKISASADRITIAGALPERPDETFGVSGLSLTANLPLSLLGDDQRVPGGRLDAQLSGALERDAKPAGTLSAKATGTPAGALDADVNIEGVPTPLIDALAQQPGLVSGLAGDTLSVRAKLTRSGAATPADVRVALSSPTLSVSPVRLDIRPDSVRSTEPVTIAATASPAWLRTVVFTGTSERGAALTPAEPAQLRAQIRTLAVSRDAAPPAQGTPPGGPFRPGIFAIDADASIDRLALRAQTKDTRGVAGQTAVTLERLAGTVTTARDGAIGLKATVGSMSAGAARSGTPAKLDAALRNYADAQGRLTIDTAVKDLTLAAPAVPTALIDALTGNALDLMHLIGPEIAADVAVRNLSPVAGSVDVKLTSAKSTLSIAGPVTNGTIDVARGRPLSLSLKDYSYDTDTQVMKLFPMFARVAKRAGSPPSLVTSEDLMVPIDGDFTKFNGTIRVDVGAIDYSFDKQFGQFLEKSVFAGGSGSEQRPVSPFTVTARSGIASWPVFTIPVRNYSLRNRGTIDLVQRRADIITYIPTLAASEGVLGNISKDLGGILGKLTPSIVGEATDLPIRTSGPLDNLQSKPDPGLMAEEFGSQLKASPEKIIDAVGGLIDLFGNKKKDPPKK